LKPVESPETDSLSEALSGAVEMVESLDLKDLMLQVGRQQAFALMANQSSIAQAQILRRIKREKGYKQLGLTWEEFCDQYAGANRTTVEAMIKRLNEFGENYYRLTEVMRVSPEVYRQIEGSIDERGMIIHGGDRVEITRQNAEIIRQIVDAGRAALRTSNQAAADAKNRAKEMTAARDKERERADALEKAERKRKADEASLTAGLSPVMVRLTKASNQISRALLEIQAAAHSPEITEGEHTALRGMRDWFINQIAATTGIPLDPMTAELLEPVDIGVARVQHEEARDE